jgi:predicted ATP-grasp superfamily ATP-dependent carboligase
VRTRVLIAADESPGPLAAVRGLHQGGFAPCVAVSHDASYAARSRHAQAVVRVRAPDDGAEAHADDLAAAARRLGVAAVLPATEASLVALTGREDRFGEVVVGTGPGDALRRATDKSQLASLAEPHGLRTPPTRVLGADLRVDASMLPAIVKPARTVRTTDGGALHTARATVVTTEAELRRATGRLSAEPWLVQPFVTGELRAVSGVAWRGRALSVLHQRSPLVWPPGTGVTALAVTTPADRVLEGRVARLLGELGWSGIFNLQFLHGDHGSYLIDVNPRVYGSMALAVAAGHNLPAIWAATLLGRAPQVPVYEVGVCLRVEERYVRARLAQLRGGRVRVRPVVPEARHIRNAVASWNDPGPLLTVASRALATVRRAVPGARDRR